jgi:O-acetyl-ADP-ribose deacetylase (regulator of RNase III)
MLHFCSLNSEWIAEIERLFSGVAEVLATVEDIRGLPRTNVAFVSPANSLGFMDGGIDLHLSRTILPGIEGKVKRAIRDIGHTTSIGRAYLPVGSAIYVAHDNSSGLIVAPTMFLPHPVRGTKNAYHSFYAALKVWKVACPTWDLVVTSHCCGVGGMPVTEAAAQMFGAYRDFLKEGVSGVRDSPHIHFYANKDLEQPDNYDNREIKELYMSREDVLAKVFAARR